MACTGRGELEVPENCHPGRRVPQFQGHSFPLQLNSDLRPTYFFLRQATTTLPQQHIDFLTSYYLSLPSSSTGSIPK
jgi:hypothetical protein